MRLGNATEAHPKPYWGNAREAEWTQLKIENSAHTTVVGSNPTSPANSFPVGI